MNVVVLAFLWLPGLFEERKREAQGLVEYALILSLMALVVIGIVTLLGSTLCTQWWDVIITSLPFGPPVGSQC